MIRYIVGTKDKGNLFKDGRSYSTRSSASRVKNFRQRFVNDELEILEIIVKSKEEILVEKLEKAKDLIETFLSFGIGHEVSNEAKIFLESLNE